MAARQFSRLRPSHACSAGGNPSAQSTHQRGPSGVLNPDGAYLPEEPLRLLALLALRLRVIYGTALSAELALRQQAAQQDPEIADCLRGGVCDPIAQQIRGLEDLAVRLRRKVPEFKP